MIKLSKRTVIVTLALIAFIATAGTAFAYWASGFDNGTGSTTATIEIGSGNTVDTQLSLDAMSGGKMLVPSGRVVDSDQETATIAYTCNVVWSSTDSDSSLSAAGVTGTLAVSLTGVKVDGATQDAESLPFVIVYSDGTSDTNNFAITGDTQLPLTFTITMNEPTKSQYDLLNNKTVVFTFSFTATSA